MNEPIHISIDHFHKQLAAAQKNAHRYLALRRMVVELSLGNETIASLVRDQTELDAAISGETT